MMLPDCRNDDVYNEEFLVHDDKKVLAGMDYAFEQIENLFNNLDVYGEELSEADTPYNLQKVLEDNSEVIMKIMTEWYESERNEVITAMIDNMEEDVYRDNRTRTMNFHTDKEFYDTRKYMIIGKKESSDKGTGDIEKKKLEINKNKESIN